jgi:SAM-dependent methyltransferase
MLDLVQLGRRPLFPPGGVDLCRQIALLTATKEGDEVLVVPSGLAGTLEYFVQNYSVHGSGVEDDPAILDRAEDRLRSIGLLDRVHVRPGAMDGLPFRDDAFDVVIGELGLTAHVPPKRAVSELVRVAKPGASVVLVQPVWRSPVESARGHVLSEHLGLSLITISEWKNLLRKAGVEGLHTEDWSDEGTSFRPQISRPFPDFSEMFTFSEKLRIFYRAKRRWGWAGVWTAWVRQREVHNLLARERSFGLHLITGLKGAGSEIMVERAADAPAAVEMVVADTGPLEHPVTDLPLFAEGAEERR